MTWNKLDVTEHKGVVTVALNRPEKLNAIDKEMFDELDTISKQLRKRKDIRAVILTGNGGTFSSGIDIKSIVSDKSKILNLLAKLLPGNANLAQRVSRNWRMIPVPVIAVIEGRCYGGGLQIVMGADIRIVAPSTELSIMEVRWGLVPDMGGLLALREVVSKDVALKLTLTGDIITAEQALEFGVVTEVCDQPMQAAQALCAKITKASPDAIAAIKHTTNRCWVSSERSLLAKETFSQIRLLLGKNFQIAVKRQRTSNDIEYKDRQSFW